MEFWGKRQSNGEWREENLGKNGNMRDDANMAQLVCLLNLESLNSVYIKQGLGKEVRLQMLNETAINQMELLLQDKRIEQLEDSKMQ